MVNHYVPDVYDERVHRLALGLEPMDAATQLPAAPVVRVQVEDVPQPHFRRPQPRGRCLYDDGLPPIDRHPSGRFAVLYSDEPRDPVTVRAFDCERWYVPRRLRMPILTVPQLIAHENAASSYTATDIMLPPQPPFENRIRRPVLFPGAAYRTDSGATGLRGRVFRVDQPVRWARIEARDPGNGAVLGRAHGDDRGEFLLIIGSVATPGNVASLVDPVPVRIRIAAPTLAPVPDPSTAADPLWDLQVEETPEIGEADPVSSGDVLPNGYQFFPAATRVEALPAGRITSRVVPFRIA